MTCSLTATSSALAHAGSTTQRSGLSEGSVVGAGAGSGAGRERAKVKSVGASESPYRATPANHARRCARSVSKGSNARG